MLRGINAATLLTILLENLFSVKCYNKSNMNVFTLSLSENFWLGLIYLEQFSCLPKRHWQAVQTQIRLLLKKQSDQGLSCLLF